MTQLNIKFILISFILIFILSPISAGLLATILTKDPLSPPATVSKLTKDELTEVLKRDSIELPAGENINDIANTLSIEQIGVWWNIVSFSLKSNDNKIAAKNQIMLISKFNNNIDSINVVLGPGENFDRVNISENKGVPYEVIDKINEFNNNEE